jgi:hypothetical protein
VQRPHYLLGHAIAALVVAHLCVPMSDGEVGAIAASGLYVPTAAGVLVFLQVAHSVNAAQRASIG